jgi:hypothetical protein
MLEGIVRHHHPIVRYAAGWAATEAAQYRERPSQPRQISLSTRMTSLEFASQQWLESCAALFAGESQATNHLKRGEYYIHGLRALNALGSLPVMKLVAQLHTDELPSQTDITAELGRARHAQLENGMRAMTAPGLIVDQLIHRAGFLNELSAQWVLQDNAADTNHFFVPASMRFDHHVFYGKRADLVAHDIDGVHFRTMIQVSKDEKSYDPDTKTFPVTGSDIYLPGRSSPLHTIRALYDKEKGVRQTPELLNTLGGLSVQLGQRFNGYVTDLHQSFRDNITRRQLGVPPSGPRLTSGSADNV